jgi:hypothetical protein
MQITKLQLAFLYAILANVGISTPAGHPQYSLKGLLSTQVQERYILHAINLFDEVESEYPDEQAAPSSESFMRCHLMAIITFYQQNAAQYQQAWYSCKRAIKEAHKCRLFYLQEWQHRSLSTIHTIKILQGEIYFLFNWMAFTVGSMDSIPFEPNFPPIAISPVQSDDILDQAMMRQKMQSCTVARNISKTTQSQDFLQMSRNQALQLAIQMDDGITDYCKSQHPLIQDTLQYSNIDTNDRTSVNLATFSLLAKSGSMLQRWRLAQSLYEKHPLDFFQHIALSSARITLQMIPVVEKCFRSPWQSTTVRAWIDGFYNQALYVFLSAIKTQIYQDQPCQASTSDSRYKQAVRGELVWFMTHFNSLYDSMNRLGMVRTTLAQCAAALKETPVEIRQDYASSPESLPSSPSIATPIDEPIFQLSRDVDFPLSRYEEVSSIIKDHCTNHTVFKFAVEAHSSP